MHNAVRLLSNMKYGLSLLQKSTAFAFVLFLAFSPLLQVATTRAQGVKIFSPTGQIEQIDSDIPGVYSSLDNIANPPILDGGIQGTRDAIGLGLPAAGVTQEAPKDAEVSTDCNIFNGWIGIAGCVTGFVYIFTVGLGSAVAFVGASFLNLAVHLSLNSASYSLDFVSLGWTTARDIANMAFIFILVYLALVIMFQANTAHTMHTLAQVILVALFINFSFFLTRVVIDAGNILGVQFYNAIVANGKTEPVAGNIPLAAAGNFSVDPAGDAGPKIYIPDLTASIMQGLDVQKAINSESFKVFAEDHNNFGGFVPYTIALSFLYISIGAMFFMLAAAFLTAGVKFLVRIVYLWFMIIAAPLALVARVSGLHMFDKYYTQWRNALLSHAMYPVAFLFVFWILSQFMGSLNASNYLDGIFAGLSQSDLTAGGANPVTGFMLWVGRFIANLGLRLGFVIALLYVAIKASETLSVYGSGFADKFGQTFSLGGLSGYRNRVQGAAVFGGLFAARTGASLISNPVGGAAAGYSSVLKNSGLLNKGGLGGWAARGLNKNVLQPASNLSLVGERSFAAGDKIAKQRGNEAKGRELLRNALANPQAITKSQEAELNHLNPELFGGISASRLQRIMHVLNEDTRKKIEGLDSISADDKHHLVDAWHAVNPAAPQQKADDIVPELRRLDASLGGLSNGTETIANLLQQGNGINKIGLKSMREMFENKMSALTVNYDYARSIGDKPAMVAADAERVQAKRALDATVKLAEEVGKHPTGYKVKP